MRTIKFRGYSKDFTENEWFFGNLIDKGNGSFQILEKNPKIWDLCCDGITVIPESIGQFTGLHDKNGKEIYEGDIVKDEFGRIMKIEYWNHRLCFVAISKTNFHHADFYDWVYRDISTDLLKTEIEVIGNIYENSELL